MRVASLHPFRMERQAPEDQLAVVCGQELQQQWRCTPARCPGTTATLSSLSTHLVGFACGPLKGPITPGI